MKQKTKKVYRVVHFLQPENKSAKDNKFYEDLYEGTDYVTALQTFNKAPPHTSLFEYTPEEYAELFAKQNI